MSRTRVRRRRAALLLAGVVVMGAWTGPVANAFGRGEGPMLPLPGHRYVVRAGDTLWSIAGRVAPGEDPRAVVDSIVRANRVVAAALVPGQALVIPNAG